MCTGGGVQVLNHDRPGSAFRQDGYNIGQGGKCLDAGFIYMLVSFIDIFKVLCQKLSNGGFSVIECLFCSR